MSRLLCFSLLRGSAFNMNNGPTSQTLSLRSMYRSAYLCSFGFFIVSFLLPIIAYGYMGASGIEVGFIFSLQTLGFALFSPVAGGLTRRRFRRQAVFAGAVVRAVSYLGMAVAIILGSVQILIANSTVWGLGAAFYVVGMNAEISDLAGQSKRSEAFGRREGANSGGSITGAIVGFFMIAFFEVQYVFVFFAVMNVIGGLVALTGPSTPQDLHSDEQPSRLRGRLGVSLVLLIAAASLSTFIGALLAPFVQVFILFLFPSISIELLALVYLPGAILTATLGGVIGRAGDRFNKTHVVTAAVVIGAICTLLLAHVDTYVGALLHFLPILAQLGENGVALVLIAVLFSTQSVVGLLAYTVMTSVFGTAYEGRAGEGFGLYEGALGSARFLGPLTGGFLWDTVSERSPFILVSAAGLMVAPVYYAAMKLYGRSLPDNHTIPRSDQNGLT